MARSVNFVWNYCNEVSSKSITYNNKWLSEYDLNYLLKGCSKSIGIAAQSMTSISCEYVKSRVSNKKAKLNWRSRKSLGWIPFTGQTITKFNNSSFRYYGHNFKFWQSRVLPGKNRCGSFNQDAKGNWYINLTCEDLQYTYKKTGKSVGVDLGLRATASYSDGTSFDNARYYQKSQEKLSKAQRAKKKKQVKNIHRKIANQRKDALHKETTRLIKEYDLIVVGDVSSKKLVKTRMAKSVHDVSWGIYKTLLAYKTIRFGKEMKVVKESFSTVTCSSCFGRTGPSGLSGLKVREWACSECGEIHDRDTNAAKNILRFGSETPIKGAAICGEINQVPGSF